MSELWPRLRQPLSVAGIGLLALDLVEAPATPVRASAGGSCANVLLALAFLGWRAHAIGRLREDAAGREVRADFARWGVNTTLIGLAPTAATPVIRHIILDREGQRTHRFSLKCRRCGTWLPTYRAVTRQALRADSTAASLVDNVDVLYIDRPSPGAALLAERAAASDVMIVFEPSGEGATTAFGTIAGLADVIKYSRAQGARWPLPPHAKPRLEVETRGSEGLWYRTRASGATNASSWRSLGAIHTATTRDAAGAGDWTTAGILQVLGHARKGEGFTEGTIKAALRCGQALASWTCAFEGARGGMRVEAPSLVKRRVTDVLRMDDATRCMSVRSALDGHPPTEATYCGTCSV